MVQALLFDFWGTLVENGVWSPIKQVKNILKIGLPFSDYVLKMEKAMMTSSFVSLKEALVQVCKEFSIEPEETIIEELVGMWNKNWMLAQPYEEVIATLKTLRSKYQLILVSNSDCFSVPKVLEKFNMKELFDKVFLSYEIGTIKTERNFMRRVLSELSLNVDDCVMIGDSIQSDIMTAKRLGMKTVLIDRKNTRDFHPKIKNLKELENVLQL